MSIAPRIAVLMGAGLTLGAGLPAQAIDALPGQLGYDDVANFATPGAVWCFEPQKNTCSFITRNRAPVKGNPRYDVIEMWDDEVVLTVQTGGVLRRDGLICEHGIDYLDTSLLTDREDHEYPDALQAEVRAKLHEMWAGYEDVEYCYAYTMPPDAQNGLFVQTQYENGEPTGSVLEFVMDYTPDARERYRLRTPALD